MSIAVFSRFEAAAIPLCVSCCNNVCEDSRQFISNTPFDDFNVAREAYMPNTPDYFWRKNYSDARTWSNCFQENSLVTDLENQYPSQKQWTKALPSNIQEDKYEPIVKNSKIWRPFSPSPSRPNETQNIGKRVPTESIKSSYSEYHTIIPSRVKLEPSKSSSFKPFKKKSYNCSHCSMTYLTSTQLVSHMRVHTGSKPYRCEFTNCFKTFARNEELTRHRLIHSGYKPHLCTVCGKSFGRKDHLGKHLKTHLQASEKKIYICCIQGCGHRYTRSDALTRHKSTAHSIQKVKPRMGNKKRDKDERNEKSSRNEEH